MVRILLAVCLLATALAYATAATSAKSVDLTIAAADRIAAKTSVSATLAFTTLGQLPIAGKITLNYPSGFFAAGVTPTANGAGTTSVATMTAVAGATGATSLVITTAVAGISTMTAFTITLSGLTMGTATAGSDEGITVQTDSDTAASRGAPSGTIGAPHTVYFVINSSDRLHEKAGVPVTLTFTTAAALAAGGKITLSYPSGFFKLAVTPTANGAGTTSVGTMTASADATGATSLVITTAVAGIPANTAFTITLSGLQMGVATLGSDKGITVQTSTANTIVSAGATSGFIGAPQTVGLVIAATDRINLKAGVPVTLTFEPIADIAAGGKITLSYPSGFFKAGVTPTANGAGTTSVATMTAEAGATGATSLVITTAVAQIPATAGVFTITLSGLTMGVATLGSNTGITVQTSTANTIASRGAPSGTIGAPHTVGLAIAATDRMHLKAGVPVTLTFTTAAALTIDGKITLSYPSGFFAAAVTPTANGAGTASVATMTAVAGATGATSLVITTAVAGIPANTAFTITLSGLTMGTATAGSDDGITVQTSTDLIVSAGADSGYINTAVTSVGFVIAAAKRAPASTAAALTLSFTPTSDIQVGGKITLNYPSGFFAAAVTPTANAAGSASVATMTAVGGATGATSLVITTSIAGAAAGAVFTITLSGLTMGAATAGGSVTVQTDTDIAPSPSALSGGLGTQATAFTATPSATTLAAASTSLVIKFTATTAVPAAGTISFWFPTGWFDTTAAPTANAAGSSSVATLTATSAFSGNKITITTAVAPIPIGAFTITLSGLKTGATAVTAGMWILATSTDTVSTETASPALGSVAASKDSTKSPSSSIAVSAIVFVSFALMMMF